MLHHWSLIGMTNEISCTRPEMENTFLNQINQSNGVTHQATRKKDKLVCNGNRNPRLLSVIYYRSTKNVPLKVKEPNVSLIALIAVIVPEYKKKKKINALFNARDER